MNTVGVLFKGLKKKENIYTVKNMILREHDMLKKTITLTVIISLLTIGIAHSYVTLRNRGEQEYQYTYGVRVRSGASDYKLYVPYPEGIDEFKEYENISAIQTERGSGLEIMGPENVTFSVENIVHGNVYWNELDSAQYQLSLEVEDNECYYGNSHLNRNQYYMYSNTSEDIDITINYRRNHDNPRGGGANERTFNLTVKEGWNQYNHTKEMLEDWTNEHKSPLPLLASTNISILIAIGVSVKLYKENK